ncbi:unnamed protein product [Rhizoctonia solani]|uniref:Transmembrane protein n=1 Tax=Rhizoctonia solani TaxID=456999 RepID=A0A8H3HJV1_9AGAM|nr:unnamed protein product [Rhizoctonia solani]
MVHGESSSARSSNETLVGRPEADPLPSKQGEIGYVPTTTDRSPTPNETRDLSDLPARHPADRSPSPPNLDAQPTQDPTTPVSHPTFKQFLRTPRPLPTIYGVRSSIVLRVVFITCTLIASIIGWIVASARMSAWDKKSSVFHPPQPSISTEDNNPISSDPLGQMTHSSLVFVHVAFGSAVLFQLLVLERSVYRFRTERYAYLHPEEMAAMTEANGAVAFSPWNRPPLPTYATALGVRGTGDVEDNVIAAPPPPEYGNTRGSTLILASQFSLPRLEFPASSHAGDRQDALGRSAQDWSRPVSYGEDEMRENLRRSLDLEAALARLEGPARPESALTRR